MAHILKSIYKFESKFDAKVTRFAYRHSYLAFLITFIGMPLVVLIAVGLGTLMIILPISFLCGW